MEKGKPISKTIKRITREVRMVMTGDQVREALTIYINRNFREFRGMTLDFEMIDDVDYEFEVIAVDERYESDEGTKSGRASDTGATADTPDSATGNTVEGEPGKTEEVPSAPDSGP